MDSHDTNQTHEMQSDFEIEALAAQCPSMDAFWGMDNFSNQEDPLWMGDGDDSLVPVTTPVLEDSNWIETFPPTALPDTHALADEMVIISDTPKSDSILQTPVACQSAIVRIEAPTAALWNTWNPSAFVDLVSSPSSENEDPTYPIDKFSPTMQSPILSPERAVVRLKPKNKPEYQAFDDPTGLFPDFVGWSVILSTPYGHLLAEKKIPVGTIMYARNRLVYVWVPQKHFDKYPILSVGEFTMPKSQCGSTHALCFKRPYSKFTTTIAPSAPTEFFICMDPKTDCRSNAHKSTGSNVILNICMDPSTVSKPIAQYRLDVQSYDSQAKSGRVLSGILCMAFLLTGAMGTIFKGSESKSHSTSRVLLSSNDDSDSAVSSWHDWIHSIFETISNVLMSSPVGDVLLGLLMLTSFFAVIKCVDFDAATKTFKASFKSGRIWTTLLSVALFFSVLSRCYSSATAPSLSGLGNLEPHLSLYGFQLSPISLVVLLFSAQYFLNGEGDSPQSDDDDSPRGRVIIV
eukprot:TRINITY_DN669_c0_g1_i1.p1 TRINITY_DN669_c0_g1~~TRINITY_DN669_c0_g1_i1.p1  ORF type:complete len:517 (+),score=87.17 TRINITY_DN669_c0_g1_i1:105-1655(+)